MAFGDITQTDSEAVDNDTSVDASMPSAIDEDSLLIAAHFTGDVNSSGPIGWSTALTLTNSTEVDEGAIYYKIAGAGESQTITCTSDASDENVIVALEIEGPWDSSPLDKTATTGRTAGVNSLTTGTTATTSRAGEIAIAIVCIREPSQTATWTNSFVADGWNTSSFKTIDVGTKVLSSTQAVETTASWTTSDVALAGVATFMAPSAGPRIPRYGFINFQDPGIV